MYNEITCIGWIGKNVEQKVLGNGTQLVKFQLGCQRSYTKKNADGSDATDQNGNKQRETDWLNIVCWRKTAELVTRLGYQTGDLVMVRGKVEVSKYTGQDGSNKISWEINADQTLILKRKNGNAQGGAFASQPQQQQQGGGFGQQQGQFGQQPQQQQPQQPAQQGNFQNFNSPQNFQPQQPQQQPFGTAPQQQPQQQAPQQGGGFGAPQTQTNFQTQPTSFGQ